ncbi:hypothetical protein VMCG_04093 [Cytospora schulzeri]|uniref:Nephrocystin 3-like N-terminal domain-containing protein n=1 Tax=Cytospora schulzeri TaxID=448051 RepID=A0A423WTZ8_9PEZI|nr:hypothetical protein VMCG_04093 [Valsa malicola]
MENQPRSGRMSDLPIQYMQNRAPSLNVAYRDPSSQYDTNRNAYVVSNEMDIIFMSNSSEGADLQRLAADETGRFTDIMAEFMRHGHAPSTLHSFNIHGAHSWAEVLDQVDLAKERYDRKAKGKRGMPRRAVRYISDHSEIIDPWLNLLPETDYSSVVCGGLKFVFGAAAEHSRAVDTKTWGRLRDKAVRLYITILATVEGMLVWLDEKAFKKLVKTLMLQKTYGSSVTDIIAELKNRSNDLKQAAAECGQSVAVESLHLNRQTHAIVKGSLVTATKSYILNEETREQERKVLGVVEHIKSQIESGNKAWAALEAKSGTLAVLEDACDTQKRQLEVIQSQIKEATWNFSKQLSGIRASLYSGQSESPRLTRKNIQEILGVDVDALALVLGTAASAGKRQMSGSIALTSRLLQTPRFQNWLQNDSSQTILLRILNGAEMSHHITRLSQFSAALLLSMKDVEPAITIHYFCGAMSLQGDHGCGHLLRCLTAELLQLWPPEKTFPLPMDFSQLMRHELEPLWQLFSTVVQSLPPATIFCVVDGSTRYSREDELVMTIRCLMWLQSILPGDIKLKLLLTWPAPSAILELLSQDDKVILSTGIHERLGLRDNGAQGALLSQAVSREPSPIPFSQY